MSSTLPAIAIGLGIAYYTMQTANEGKKEQKKQIEEMINRRVAVDTVEKERETKRDPEVTKFTDTPAKSGMGFGYYKSGNILSKMIGDRGLPFDFGATSLVSRGGAQEMMKPSDAVATKMINPKNDLDDGLSAGWSGTKPFDLKRTADEGLRQREEENRKWVKEQEEQDKKELQRQEEQGRLRQAEEGEKWRKQREEAERYMREIKEEQERFAIKVKETAEAQTQSDWMARMATDKMNAEMFTLR